MLRENLLSEALEFLVHVHIREVSTVFPRRKGNLGWPEKFLVTFDMEALSN